MSNTLMKVGSLYASESDASQAFSIPVEPGGRQHFFVRAIPRHEDGSLGPLASELYRVTMPPPGTDRYRPYRLTHLELDAGYEASDRFASCVRVIGYRPPPAGAEWRLTFALHSYPATGTYCKDLHFPPQAPSCEWWECFGEFIVEDVVGTVGGAYDLVKTTIDDIKTLALDLSSQLNPFCLQAGLVSEDAEDVCDSILRTGSEIVVDAYLTANGIPPTLPSFGDLAAAAQGDLAVLGAGLLEQIGVPCSSMSLSESEAWAAKSSAEAAGVLDRRRYRRGASTCAGI